MDMTCGFPDLGGYNVCQGPPGSTYCCVPSGYGCGDSAVCCSGVCAGPSGSQICDGEHPITAFADGGPRCAGLGKGCFDDSECCGTGCGGGSCAAGAGQCGSKATVGQACSTDSDCCSKAVPESTICQGPKGHKLCCVASGNSCGISSVCCSGVCTGNLCQ
jgi:hypothetical protein